MKTQVGTLAFSGIEERFGPDPATGVLTALHRFARELASGSPELDLPRFLATDRGPELGEQVEIDDELLDVLAREARTRSVNLDDLLNHAVFLYLAAQELPSPDPSAFATSSPIGLSD